jgi:hypothetical protein
MTLWPGQRKLHEAWKTGVCQPGPSLSKVRAPRGNGGRCWTRIASRRMHEMMLESVALTDLLHT